MADLASKHDLVQILRHMKSKHHGQLGITHVPIPLGMLDQICHALQGETSPEHPESHCQKCHGPNVTWFVASDLWNRAHGEWDILCQSCFVQLAEAAGINPTAWQLGPERHDTTGCTCPPENSRHLTLCPVMQEAIRLVRTAVKTSCRTPSIDKPPQLITASASTDGGAPSSRTPSSSVECPKCRTQLAFEGDVCGLCP